MIVAYAPDLADRSRIDAALTGVTFVKSVAELASVATARYLPPA